MTWRHSLTVSSQFPLKFRVSFSHKFASISLTIWRQFASQIRTNLPQCATFSYSRAFPKKIYTHTSTSIHQNIPVISCVSLNLPEKIFFSRGSPLSSRVCRNCNKIDLQKCVTSSSQCDFQQPNSPRSIKGLTCIHACVHSHTQI